LLVVLLARPLTLAAAAASGIGEKVSMPDQPTDGWKGFVVLCLVTICRSIVFAGFNTFLALYWMKRWAVSPTDGAAILGLFLGVGLTGTLLGGRLGDQLGHRAVLRAGFGMAAIVLPAMLLANESLSA